MSWPNIDEEDAYVWVDHRDEEESIVVAVSERLDSEDELIPRLDDEGNLFVTHRRTEVQFPVTMTRHDRYVAISSLAELLKEKYLFFVNPSNEGDTHPLLVVTSDNAAQWGTPPNYLEQLRLGIDYFSLEASGKVVKVPYLNHDEPDFEEQRAEFENTSQASSALAEAMMGLLFSGKADEGKLRELVKHISKDPELKAQFGSKSDDEILAELTGAFNDVAADPEVQSAKHEVTSSINEIRSLISGEAQKKPWWKFW